MAKKQQLTKEEAQDTAGRFYANGGWQGLEPPSFYEQDSEEIECEECEGEGRLIEKEREVICPECNGKVYIKPKK